MSLVSFLCGDYFYRLIVIYQWSTYKELGGPLAMDLEEKTPYSRVLVPLPRWSKVFRINGAHQMTVKLLTQRPAAQSESTSPTSNAP